MNRCTFMRLSFFFSFLCFLAAAILILPLAVFVCSRCDAHWRTMFFCFFMLIVFPALSFVFTFLLRRSFARDCKKRNGVGVGHRDDVRHGD